MEQYCQDKLLSKSDFWIMAIFMVKFGTFLTLITIFTHQTGVRIASFRHTVAHVGEEDSHSKKFFGAPESTDAVLKV